MLKKFLPLTETESFAPTQYFAPTQPGAYFNIRTRQIIIVTKSMTYVLAPDEIPFIEAEERIELVRPDESIDPPLFPVRDSRTCGICGVRDIPYGVDWKWWTDGCPVHMACYYNKDPE